MHPGEEVGEGVLRARATARPPTPRAVTSGAMDTPRVSRATSTPITRTTIRVMLTKMDAEAATPVRVPATDWTRPATTRAALSVAIRMSSAVRDWFTKPETRAVSGRVVPATAAPAMRGGPGGDGAQRVDDDVVTSPPGPLGVPAQPPQEGAEQESGRGARRQSDPGDQPVVQDEIPVQRTPTLPRRRPGGVATDAADRRMRCVVTLSPVSSSCVEPRSGACAHPERAAIVPHGRCTYRRRGGRYRRTAACSRTARTSAVIALSLRSNSGPVSSCGSAGRPVSTGVCRWPPGSCGASSARSRLER
ncbi:hypothetical protein SAVIM40S_03263 [Streptomyces avidinii]